MNKALETERLLPCPFCGMDEAYITDTMPAGAYWCVCGHCGAETQSSQRQSEAIAAWNRRSCLDLSQAERGGEPVAMLISLDGETEVSWFEGSEHLGPGDYLYAAPQPSAAIDEDMVEPTVAEAMEILAAAIDRESKRRAQIDQAFSTMFVNIEKGEPTAEFATALRDWWITEKPKLFPLTAASKKEV